MNDKRKLIWYAIVNIVIPVIVGVCIYFLVRPDTYISQAIYRLCSASIPSDALHIYLPNWLRLFLANYAADMLWAYSLTFAVYIIFCDGSVNMLWVLAICIVFETVMELFQLYHVLSGTFDWWDIALEICATVMGSLNILFARRKFYESVQ